MPRHTRSIVVAMLSVGSSADEINALIQTLDFSSLVAPELGSLLRASHKESLVCFLFKDVPSFVTKILVFDATIGFTSALSASIFGDANVGFASVAPSLLERANGRQRPGHRV